MEIKEKEGCYDVIDEELGCILSIRKDDRTIVIWQSAFDAMKSEERSEEDWLVIRQGRGMIVVDSKGKIKNAR